MRTCSSVALGAARGWVRVLKSSCCVPLLHQRPRQACADSPWGYNIWKYVAFRKHSPRIIRQDDGGKCSGPTRRAALGLAVLTHNSSGCTSLGESGKSSRGFSSLLGSCMKPPEVPAHPAFRLRRERRSGAYRASVVAVPHVTAVRSAAHVPSQAPSVFLSSFAYAHHYAHLLFPFGF